MTAKLDIFPIGIICGLIITTIFAIQTGLVQVADFGNSLYEIMAGLIPIDAKMSTPPTKSPSLGVVTGTGLSIELGGNATGIYYPMYDITELPDILEVRKAYPIMPFNVNINPESGPGTEPSADWASAIAQLKDAGIVVTGYVPTGYGTTSVADVEDMISKYRQFYPNMIDGIMLDEVSGLPSDFKFYQTISNYTRSLGYSYMGANAGGPIDQSYVSLFDQIAIYESPGYPDESTLTSTTFYPQYSKSVIGFGATIHSQPTYNATWLKMATKYLKWVYITDQTEPNPYAVSPSFLKQYARDLSSLDIIPSMNNLVTTVNTMHLQNSKTTNLVANLETAINSFSSNNTHETKNQLNAFINKVNAQTGKKIDQGQSIELIQDAQNIIDSIH